MQCRSVFFHRGACAWVLTIACAAGCASDPPDDKYGAANGGVQAGGAAGNAAASGANPGATSPGGPPPTVSNNAGTNVARAGSGAAAAGAGSTASPGASGAAGSASPASGGAAAPEVPKAEPGYLVAHGAKLYDSQGREARIAGVSWFGLESGNYAPFGLSNQSLDQLLDRVVAMGFNTLRLPFCNQLFDSGSRPNVNQQLNPTLANMNGLQLIDAIVKAAGQRKLKVMLDRHRPDANAQSDLWYTSQYDEARWIKDWEMLATHFKAEPTVFAVDLHNEPKGAATWGDGNMMTDWKAAAERAGNAILAVNPNLLIVVEGIEKIGSDYYWWGGQLAAAGDKPVKLAVENRLVYSAHDYPASLYPQPWFMAADYPANLASVWTNHWGYLVEKNIAPVFVGEFGTKLETDSDKKWLHALASYIGDRGISFAYWSLNPNSNDTGGLLKDDWMTVQTAKLDELKPIQAPVIE